MHMLSPAYHMHVQFSGYHGGHGGDDRVAAKGSCGELVEPIAQYWSDQDQAFHSGHKPLGHQLWARQHQAWDMANAACIRAGGMAARGTGSRSAFAVRRAPKPHATRVVGEPAYRAMLSACIAEVVPLCEALCACALIILPTTLCAVQLLQQPPSIFP